MSTSYLDRFRSGLREVQSQQILSLLSKEKDSGAITTVQEFKTRLEELTAHLQAQTIQPTLQLFLGEISDIIDSESFNFMMERVSDDLAAAYSEMNSIDEVLASHENLINDVVLINLEIAVNNLEAQIESFEFLNKNNDGFDNVIFNTFRTTQKRSQETIVFTDPKTGLISTSTDVTPQIDPVGEKLVMGSVTADLVTAASVRQVYDFESIASELDVEFDNSDINNLIDNTNGTFWAQSILLSQPRDETGVITKLEIDLGGVKSINSIEVEPIILYPVDIVGISIIDPNNQTITILSEAVEAKSNNKFFFTTTSARKVIIKVRNKNYTPVQFRTKPGSPLPDLTRDLSSISGAVQNISEDLKELVSSPLLTQALAVDDFPAEDKSFYEYLIGFDNIKLGFNTFNTTSIFTSKTEKVSCLGQLSLRVNEKRPLGDIDSTTVEYTTDTYPTGTDDYFHGSTEYYLLKRDFSEADALLDVTTLPILPVGVEGVRHETLHLTNKSSPTSATPDIGFFQFHTLNDPYHSIDNPTGDVKVYRNGQLLENADAATGANAALESDGWTRETTLSQDTPGQPLRMRYAVQIQNPNPNNIYTISYSPTVSTTNVIPTESSPSAYLAAQGLRLVDLTGKLRAWLGKDNIVYFKESEAGNSIAYSTINLVVVMRRNSANVNLTPVLEDYLIATSCRDSSKFGG